MATTGTTRVITEQIYTMVSQRPMTYQQIADSIGMSYKTIYLRMKELREANRIRPVGRIGHQDLWQSVHPQTIPLMPINLNNDSTNPLQIVYRLAASNLKPSGLDKSSRQWPQILCGIFRASAVMKTEDKFNPERHADYKTFLVKFRNELQLRLRQVETLLQSEKFWTEEGLQSFWQDETFDANKIIKGYEQAVEFSNALQEYK